MTQAPAKPRTKPPPPPSPSAGNSRTTAVGTSAQTMVMTKATPQPPRIVLSGVEGWGKTSAGAFAPNSGIIMAGNENGYITLLGHARVPEIQSAHVGDWNAALDLVGKLTDDPQGIETLVIDSMGTLERLCHELVCQRDFNNEWGEKGFLSYHKGYAKAVNDWLEMLAALDRLRSVRGMTIVLLSHIQVKPFKNPVGADFDRYTVDCHQQTWSATHRWADAVLFGNFLTIVDEGKNKRPKGIGGYERVLYTQRCDAWDAKNRYGMPEQLDLTDNPADTWGIIANAIAGELSNA